MPLCICVGGIPYLDSWCMGFKIKLIKIITFDLTLIPTLRFFYLLFKDYSVSDWTEEEDFVINIDPTIISRTMKITFFMPGDEAPPSHVIGIGKLEIDVCYLPGNLFIYMVQYMVQFPLILVNRGNIELPTSLYCPIFLWLIA